MDKENVWPTELERLQEWGRVGLALHAACNAVIAMCYPGTAIDAALTPPTSGETRLREALADPNAVHVNMLRGGIARPSLAQIIHIYGADALRAALTKGADRHD